MDHRSKCKMQTIKLLEENREHICDLGLDKEFLFITSKT